MDFTKKHIALKKNDFNGVETSDDIKDLLLYKNLKSCDLFRFYINEEDIENINKLIELQFIKFDFCYFNIDEIKIKESVAEISFNLCENLKIKHINSTKAKKIRITQWEKAEVTYDLNEFQLAENLETLEIHNCNIKGIECLLEKAPKIKRINLDGSNVENKIYLEGLKSKIIVSNNATYDLANA